MDKKRSSNSIADFKKLYMLYVCSALLFPKSCRSFPFILIFIVDKLEKIDKYDGLVLHMSFLVKSIPESEKKTTRIINGCIMVLEVSINPCLSFLIIVFFINVTI